MGDAIANLFNPISKLIKGREEGKTARAGIEAGRTAASEAAAAASKKQDIDAQAARDAASQSIANAVQGARTPGGLGVDDEEDKNDLFLKQSVLGRG